MTEKYSRASANILLEAAELQEKKGADYNGSLTRVQQADYYEHGVWSILDTVKAKYLRIVSVLETMENGGNVNFESVEDSGLDLINYTSFLIAYMRGEVPGQNPQNDIFNKINVKSDNKLTPVKFRKQIYGSGGMAQTELLQEETNEKSS